MKTLLILLSGNFKNIAESNKIDQSNVEILKIDEKDLSNFRKIIKILRNFNGDRIYFGTTDLSFQRFQTFIKAYLFLSFQFNSAIIDEQGKRNKFSLSKLFFVELPLFMIEIIYSTLLVIYYHIKIPILKWKYTKR